MNEKDANLKLRRIGAVLAVVAAIGGGALLSGDGIDTMRHLQGISNAATEGGRRKHRRRQDQGFTHEV